MRDKSHAVCTVRLRQPQTTPASPCGKTANKRRAHLLEVAEAASEIIENVIDERVGDFRWIPAQPAYGPKRENQPTPLAESEFPGQVPDKSGGQPLRVGLGLQGQFAHVHDPDRRELALFDQQSYRLGSLDPMFTNAEQAALNQRSCHDLAGVAPQGTTTLHGFTGDFLNVRRLADQQ